MEHEDQIEFYRCPLCGRGTGNDVEENNEDEKHDCPVEAEMRAEDHPKCTFAWSGTVKSWRAISARFPFRYASKIKQST